MTHVHHQNNFSTGVSAPGTSIGATATPLSAVPSVDSPFYLVFDPLSTNSRYEAIYCTGKTATSVTHAATTVDHSTGDTVWMCLTAEELDQISLDTETVNTNAAASMPTGALVLYGKAAVPSGYLACDGSAVSRTTYAALFGVLSTVFGAGDGSTTFNLPNLQGSVVAGYKSNDTSFDAIAETGGAKTINLQHSHTFNTHNHALSGSSSTSASLISNDDGGQTTAAPPHTHTAASLTVGNQSAATSDNQLSTAQSIMNKFVTVYYLIKT